MITEPKGFEVVALARRETMPMQKIDRTIVNRKELLKQDRSTERTSPPRGPLPIYLHRFASSRPDRPYWWNASAATWPAQRQIRFGKDAATRSCGPRNRL